MTTPKFFLEKGCYYLPHLPRHRQRGREEEMNKQYVLMIQVEDDSTFFSSHRGWGNKEQALEEAQKLQDKLPENLAVWVNTKITDDSAERVGPETIYMDSHGNRRVGLGRKLLDGY